MPRPRSDIRPRVIEAARRQFLQQGVDGASLRRIAADAGTSIGMIYYYFPTKDDLFLAVVEDVYAGALDDLTTALRSGADVEERLRNAFARLARMDEREFEVVRLVIREAMISSKRLGSLVERFSRGHLPLLWQTVHEGLATGAIDGRHPLPAVFASLAASAILPQLVHRRIDAELPAVRALLPDRVQLADAVLEVVLAGLRPRPPVGRTR
jgi:AcrR family transcriptional regulator